MSFKTRLATLREVDKIERMVNAAYRGDTARRTWTHEADMLGGQRVDTAAIREEIERPDSVILVAVPETELETICGCVHLEKTGDDCYLGMLTVDVSRQQAGIGDFLLRESERFAREHFGAKGVVMTVISTRAELIAWYGRRGYVKTGETRPFPYGNERFGIPLRDDLFFEVFRKSI